MRSRVGNPVPEDNQQNFGAWLMDCLLTEAVARAGGRAGVQYVVVLNSMYRRVAMVAAGAATAPPGTPYWHGSLAIEDINDARIGNVYESLAGVWFFEAAWPRILDLLCLIIDIQDSFLDRRELPEVLRGSESLVWGGPRPAAMLAEFEIASRYGRRDADQRLMEAATLEDLLIAQYHAFDLRH